MPEKHDRPAESHAVVFRQKKKNFFFFFYIHRMGGEKIFYFSHTVVFRQKKKNFFSSSTYTGWGEKKYSTSLH